MVALPLPPPLRINSRVRVTERVEVFGLEDRPTVLTEDMPLTVVGLSDDRRQR